MRDDSPLEDEDNSTREDVSSERSKASGSDAMGDRGRKFGRSGGVRTACTCIISARRLKNPPNTPPLSLSFGLGQSLHWSFNTSHSFFICGELLTVSLALSKYGPRNFAFWPALAFLRRTRNA